MGAMEMTPVQRRTLEVLIGTGERPAFPADLAQRLRDRIEEAVRGLELSKPLWLGKGRLNERTRCEGLFQAGILGEGRPFEHSSKSAAGTLLHKAIELEVASREDLDPHTLVWRAADRLVEDDQAFRPFWRALDRLGQDEVLMEAVRRLALFQGSFPPLRPLRRTLTPIAELPVRAELLGGSLVLSGRIDLALGPLEAARATRLLLDLKSGGAYPEYPEDMRLYSLVHTLRFGAPPYRVASLFLESGEWQAEDVSEDVLRHAADRVIAAARAAATLGHGRSPDLRPGPYCSWCPRAATCPAGPASAAV